MDRESWKRLEELIDRWLDLGGPDRATLLQRVAVEDPELREQLESFLRAQGAAEGFLETSVEGQASDLLRAIREEGRSWDALQLEGQDVGPYRVVRELGRGGMGAVFLAERADGQFEQRVALKLVKKGMDSAEILDRFRAERQILARLQHANIARLLDGGVTEGGQPYFAMEHVEGLPLTSYCDQGRLSLDDRIRLFLQVCHAVEYAHRNLVVHRDLKPSNVLITRDGQAKLLDFGIAKVLDASGDASATATRREARAMTPQYAAPEQVLGQPVTTATDVYSLGAVLYELLSGRPSCRLQGAGPGEIERIARQDPEPPSSAMRRGEGVSAEEIARARGESVERLTRRLRGDLDNIVGMALRREPERRYPSAGALAEDLRGCLDGLPVAARPNTIAYRAAKFVRRHRWAVASAALLATSLLAGVLATLWQAREAVREARKAEEVKRFVFSLFELSDPDAAKGKEITARQLLERGSQRVESELATQPEIQAEMLLFVGNIYHRLGLDPEARSAFEKALALRSQRLAPDDLRVAEAELALASVCFSQGEWDRAQELFQRAFAARMHRLGADHPDTSVVQGQLGRLRFEKGDPMAAEGLLRDAVVAQRRHRPSADAELATNLNALGRVLHAKGELDAAELLYRESLQTRRRLFGEEHSRVSESLFNLAMLMKDRGDVRGAHSQYRQVLAIDRRLLGSSHDIVANDLNNLATALIAEGSYAEAEGLLRESLEIRTRLHGTDSPQLAVALHNLARALRWQGKLVEAEADSRRALGLAVTLLGEEHVNVAAVREELSHIVSGRGRQEEAETLARRALATYRQQLAAPRVADGLLTLGHVLVAGHRAAEAEDPLREALRLRRDRLAESDWRTAEARLELGECLAVLGRRREADSLLRASYEQLRSNLGPRHPLTVRGRAARDLVARHY